MRIAMINPIKLTNTENNLVYGGLCDCKCRNKKPMSYNDHNIGKIGQLVSEEYGEMPTPQKCHLRCLRNGYKSSICMEKNKSGIILLSLVSDDMVKNLIDFLVSDSSLLPEKSE